MFMALDSRGDERLPSRFSICYILFHAYSRPRQLQQMCKSLLREPLRLLIFSTYAGTKTGIGGRRHAERALFQSQVAEPVSGRKFVSMAWGRTTTGLVNEMIDEKLRRWLSIAQHLLCRVGS